MIDKALSVLQDANNIYRPLELCRSDYLSSSLIIISRMSRLLYIRHAQASYGKEDYDQLSSKGYEQGLLLGKHLLAIGEQLDYIYVGPLKRQNQTLDQVEKVYQEGGKQLPLRTPMVELEEHRGPEVLKMAMRQIKEEDEQIHRWDEERIADPSLYTRNGMLIFEKAMLLWATGMLDHHHPDQYLDWPNFRKQVSLGHDRVMSKHRSEKGKTIALFTSGGTISATLGHVLGMQRESDIIGLNGIVQNTSITEFLYDEKRITMRRFNDVSFLPDNMKTYV